MGKVDIHDHRHRPVAAASSWRMAGFDMQMDSIMVVWSGILQGLGTGFVYVPLAAATFATLTPTLRNEGTAIFSLTRNLAASAFRWSDTLGRVNLVARLGEHVSRYSSVCRRDAGRWLAELARLRGRNRDERGGHDRCFYAARFQNE